MRLETASNKAIKYACMNFHYAKSIPVNTFGFSVFNDENEWCGVVLYGSGASNNLGKQLNLKQGQYLELVRMALNGKQKYTSQVLSKSIKLLTKKNPLIKAIISFADNGQNHIGIIYQATNFYYTGEFKGDKEYLYNGKWLHPRSMSSINGSRAKDKLPKGTIVRDSSSKYRYIYPIDKKLIPLCKSLSKEYPKNAELVHKGEQETIQFSGAFDSTIPLNS